jgi:hypothetical protein
MVMLQFGAGVAVGVAVTVLAYHFHMLRKLKLWGQDWRARAISAEQEVLNWKTWAEHKQLKPPF